MGNRNVLFQIISYQVTVPSQKISATFRLCPYIADKYLHLQRKIQQVVLQAVITENICRPLHCLIHPLPAARPTPGCDQALRNFRMRETNERCLVQIVNDLAEQAVAGYRYITKRTFLDKWLQHLVHIILCCFQRQEPWFPYRIEPSLLSYYGPEEIQGAPRQPVYA